MQGLGDTCWTDATTGAQVCNGADVTGETSCAVTSPYNTPSSTTSNGTPVTISGNVITVHDKGHTARTYQFLYHSGTLDVYVTTGPGNMSCHPSCNYITVTSSGVITGLDSPPAQNETGCSNITTAVSTGTTYQTVSSTPVYTGSATYATGSNSGYVTTAAASKTATKSSSGFSLSSIPTWALVAGAAGGGLLLSKMMGKRR
jgi:hypothetical protein